MHAAIGKPDSTSWQNSDPAKGRQARPQKRNPHRQPKPAHRSHQAASATLEKIRTSGPILVQFVSRPEAAAQRMPLSDLVTVIGCRFAPSGTRYIHVRHHGEIRLAMEA